MLVGVFNAPSASTNPLYQALARSVGPTAQGAHTNPYFNSSDMQTTNSATYPSTPDSYVRGQEQLAVAKNLVSQQLPGYQMPNWCNSR